MVFYKFLIGEWHNVNCSRVIVVRFSLHFSQDVVKIIAPRGKNILWKFVQIVECRRVLKWTYAYGFYLPEQEQTKKQFFEYLQGIILTRCILFRNSGSFIIFEPFMYVDV